MTGRKPTSPAMTRFVEAVNKLGRERFADDWKPVTPRAIEDWLQDNLLPDPARPGRGSGKGRAAHYTDQDVERAVEIADLVRRHRSYDSVAAILFQQGHPIEETRLRAAFSGLLGRARAEVTTAADRALRKHRAAAGEGPEPSGIPARVDDVELAEWAEPVLTDRLKRDMRTHVLRSRVANQPGAELGTIAFGLGSLLSGTTSPTPDFWSTLAIGLGLPRELLGGDDPFLIGLNLDRLQEIVELAPLADFERARELATRLEELTARLVEARPAVEVATSLETQRSRALMVLLPFALAEQMGTDLTAVREFTDMAASLLESPANQM
jgi:MerR HTH family regulatory protein